MNKSTTVRPAAGAPLRLGIVENWAQFSLLVLVNAFVGGMVGIERSILPLLAQAEFGMAERTAILSFIAVFGLTKAGANYFAGLLGDRWGRKPILVIGWLIAVPVPFLLMWAQNWAWVIVANIFLGVSQGLAWSTAVIMKIDLAGPRNRGLAMGLNEFAGYGAVAIAAWATGYIAARYGLHPEPFYLGALFLASGLFLSIFAVRETHAHATHEARSSGVVTEGPTRPEIFRLTTWKDKNLSSASQAGLVNNLNDGLAWGLFPLIFASAGLGLPAIGFLTGLYPAVWGVTQLFTGSLSDRFGRKWLIAAGMWTQASGLVAIALWRTYEGFAVGSVILGLGTAMVYPTLLAAIGDVAHPSWRASAVGVYRLWRDLGYALGALIAGIVADLFGMTHAVLLVAGITFGSGLIIWFRMAETHGRCQTIHGVA